MFEVINYGPSKSFPTCIGNLRLPRLRAVKIQSERAAEELQKYWRVEVKDLSPEPSFNKGFWGEERSEDQPVEILTARAPGEKLVDYSVLKINALRKIAARFGIPDSFKMRKQDLITKLEEQNGT